MNKRQSLYDVASFYAKNCKLKASYQGMRYQVEQVEEGEEKKLQATVWPEPFCFEKTPEEKKEAAYFSCSEQGLDEVYQWLCSKYEQEKDRWEHAKNFPLDGLLQQKERLE